MDLNHLLSHQQHQEQPTSMAEYGRGAQSAFSEAILSQPFPFPTQPQLAQLDGSTSTRQDSGYSSTPSRPRLSPFPQPSSSFNFSFSPHPLAPRYPPEEPQQHFQQYYQHHDHQSFPNPYHQPNFLSPSPASSLPHSSLPSATLSGPQDYSNSPTQNQQYYPQYVPLLENLCSQTHQQPSPFPFSPNASPSAVASRETPQPRQTRHSSLRRSTRTKRSQRVLEDDSRSPSPNPTTPQADGGQRKRKRSYSESGALSKAATRKSEIDSREEQDIILVDAIGRCGTVWSEVEKVTGVPATTCRYRWDEIETAAGKNTGTGTRKKRTRKKHSKSRWTKEEDAKLRELLESGRPHREIMSQFDGRTTHAVRQRIAGIQVKMGDQTQKLEGPLQDSSDKPLPPIDEHLALFHDRPPSFDEPFPSFDDDLPIFDESIFGLHSSTNPASDYASPNHSRFSPSFDFTPSSGFVASPSSAFDQIPSQSQSNETSFLNELIGFGVEETDETFSSEVDGPDSSSGDTGQEEDLGGYEVTDWSAMSREDVENGMMLWDGFTGAGDVGVRGILDGTMGAAAVFDSGENEVETMDWRASEEEVVEEVRELGGSREKEESEGEGGLEEGEILMGCIDERVNGGDGHEIGTVGEEDDLEELEEGEIREGTVDLSDAREVETDSALSDVALSMPPFGSLSEFSQRGSSVPSGQGSFSYDSNGPQPSGLSAYPPPPPPPAAGSQLGSSPPGDQAPIYGRPQLGQQHQIIPGRAVKGREYIAPGPAGPLLDEFRSNRNRSWELPDLAGHVTEFAYDQVGSRHIVHKLEKATDAENAIIFNEILPNMLKLSTDVFASHVIQKFFEKGSQTQRTAMAQALEGRVLRLSLEKYGNFVVQWALESVLVDQQVRLVRELEGHVLKCARDAQSNHVVQRALERVPPEHLHFITDACIGKVYELATHRYGSRVLQRIFENCPPHQTRALLDELHRYTQQLIQDQYGNYVIQWVIEKGETPDRSQVISTISGQVLPLAQQKFASNVVEKCIVHGSEEERRRIIDELLAPARDGSSIIKTMLTGAFSHFVVEQALKWSVGAQREAIYLDTDIQLIDLRKDWTPDQRYPVSVEKLLRSERQRKAISK